MNKIQIYTSSYCPYCIKAKRLLDSKGVEYEEIVLDDSSEDKIEVMKKLNWKTVPIILIDGKLIGGYDKLVSLEKANELDELLS